MQRCGKGDNAVLRGGGIVYEYNGIVIETVTLVPSTSPLHTIV